MKKILQIILIIISVSSLCYASEDHFEELIKAKSLKCYFGPGASANWKGKKVKVELNSFDITLNFDSIDLKNQKARIIGNQGAADLIVLLSMMGINFIEQTDMGNLNITTVFPNYAQETSDFIAVTSRHLSIPGSSPLPSQYHGTCKVLE